MRTTSRSARTRRPTARALDGVPAGLLVAACLLLAPVPAGAQFTSAVQPPPRDSEPAVVVATDSVIAMRRDSAVQAERLDLRAWVDSAASALAAGAALAPPAAGGDTLARTDSTPTLGTPVRATEETVEFREGAPAPDTATPLPLLLLAGGALAGLGAALRRRR